MRHISELIKTIKVPSITLDKFCKEKNIDFVSLLKIDTEGSEISVLKGFDDYIRQKKVGLIIFEHAPILFERQEQAAEVYDFLLQRDYRIYDLKNNAVTRKELLKSDQGDFYAKPI
jgi:hypothetical protein